MKKLPICILLILLISVALGILINKHSSSKSPTPTLKAVEDAIILINNKYPQTTSVPSTKAVLGKGSGILSEDTVDGWNLLFYLGDGDCPSGCINNHEWYFKVSQSGKITKAGEYEQWYDESVNKIYDKGKKITDFIKFTPPSLKEDGVGIVEITFSQSPIKPGPCDLETNCEKPLDNYLVKIYRQDNNIAYYLGKTDMNGKFKATVLPGDYYILYDSSVKQKIKKEFSVAVGQMVNLYITVDTGIR